MDSLLNSICSIIKRKSLWKTAPGIGLGTSLKTPEQINGKGLFYRALDGITQAPSFSGRAANWPADSEKKVNS
jgi:hypothetical protein